MYGLKHDWSLEPRPRLLVLSDYEGAEPRWCPGCGDTAILAAVQRLMRDEQLPPEKIVAVSGIGCSSRLPHYLKTFGFHSLHGRALPVACGVRARRPDLHVFVATGDGDCCAIGAGHWVHAIRYNMNMTVLMFDNYIYGLTKMQTSPTTELGCSSNTHPRGALLSPLQPLAVTISITNCSFVAQTVDWNPPHLLAVIKAAHAHGGLSFVRVLQRCPHYMPNLFDELMEDRDKLTLLTHPDGIPLDDSLAKLFPNQVEHDPSDRLKAFALATDHDTVPIGLLYRNPNAERYDEMSTEGLDMSAAERVRATQVAIDRFLT